MESEAHAKVLSSAIAYCWDQLGPEDQASVLERVRLGVQETVVIHEELVEDISSAAVQAASVAAPASKFNDIWEAVSLLQLLRAEFRLHSSEKAVKFKVGEERSMLCVLIVKVY